MRCIIYTSRPTKAFSEKELEDLLFESRAKNQQLGITGMMVYLNVMFIQLIEGDETAVNKLFASIQNDLRHAQVTTLFEGNIDQRHFPEFTMGFHSNSSAMENVEGFENLKSIISSKETQTGKLLDIIENLS